MLISSAPTPINAIHPLAFIFWSEIIGMIDIDFNHTTNGVGYSFDIFNDFIASLVIIWAVAQLAKIRVSNKYQSVMQFVKIGSYLTAISAFHNDFIYDTPAVISGIFELTYLITLCSSIAFLVAMRWMSETADLAQSVVSWRKTTIWYTIVYAFPFGLLTVASVLYKLFGFPFFQFTLGMWAIILFPLLFVPFFLYLKSLRKMKSELKQFGHPIFSSPVVSS